MSLADSSVQLQKAMLAWLKADAGVAAIVADRVFDNVSASAIKPYVSFGAFQVLPEEADCSEGVEVIIQLDGWSAPPNKSTLEVKQLGAALGKSLRGAAMPLADGQRLVLMDIVQTQYMRDPDGITAHAVVTVRALTEPTA